MKIGLSKICINPQLPILLGGFAAVRNCEKIHDDLYVKILIVDDNGIFKGFISYDLIAIDHLLLDKLKEEIDLSNFVVCATHTHSGPMGTVDTENKESLLNGKEEVFGTINEGYINYLVHQTIQCYTQAINNIESCKIKEISYDEFEIGRNRNLEELPGDSKVIAFEIEGSSSKNLLLNYACHPTVLNHLNVEMSADYPGAISSKLRENYDVVLFLNGACGDISTRFTRQKSGYEEVDRYASLFSSHLLNHPGSFVNEESISLCNHSIKMRIKKPLPLEVAKQNVERQKQLVEEAVLSGVQGKELRLIESLYEGANADYGYSLNYNDVTEVDLPVTIVTFCGQKFVTIPGELFSELSNELKNKLNVATLCYANGYVMYIVNEIAYDNNWYEALSSPFEKGQGEYLIQSIQKIIEEM